MTSYNLPPIYFIPQLQRLFPQHAPMLLGIIYIFDQATFCVSYITNLYNFFDSVKSYYDSDEFKSYDISESYDSGLFVCIWLS